MKPRSLLASLLAAYFNRTQMWTLIRFCHNTSKENGHDGRFGKRTSRKGDLKAASTINGRRKASVMRGK